MRRIVRPHVACRCSTWPLELGRASALDLTGPRSNCSAHLLMASYFNAGKTKNGHETGPQGPDFGLDPRTGYHFSRRVRFRPPRGPGRPNNVRKSPGKLTKKPKFPKIIQNNSSLVQLHSGALEISPRSALNVRPMGRGWAVKAWLLAARSRGPAGRAAWGGRTVSARLGRRQTSRNQTCRFRVCLQGPRM